MYLLDIANGSTLHPPADLFIPTPTQLLSHSVITAVYSFIQLSIHCAGALTERKKCPIFETEAKGIRMRVPSFDSQRSTAELLHYVYIHLPIISSGFFRMNASQISTNPLICSSEGVSPCLREGTSGDYHIVQVYCFNFQRKNISNCA